MIDKFRRVRIVVRTSLLIVLEAVLTSSCSIFSGSGDCGYNASLDRPDGVTNVEIRIQRITDETVGGNTSCGYQQIWTKAAKMEIDGVAVPERIGDKRVPQTYVNFSDEGGVDYYYEAPANFDPRKTKIRIENKDGYTYTSRPETIKEWAANSMSVTLKR